MIVNKETIYTKDLASKKLKVEREFDAPVEKVWKAWTDQAILDEWWGPKPWKAVTQNMDFREGGKWLYYMEGPDGTKQYCRLDYKSITSNKQYTALDAFCDENGNINTDFPRMTWVCNFSKAGDGTKVEVLITFDSEADLEKIIEISNWMRSWQKAKRRESFRSNSQNIKEKKEVFDYPYSF